MLTEENDEMQSCSLGVEALLTVSPFFYSPFLGL